MLEFKDSRTISSKRLESIRKAFAQVTSEASESSFYDIPNQSEFFTMCSDLANKMLKKYKYFIVIGVGGSSMGSRALVELSNTDNITFIDNVDSIEISKVINKHQGCIQDTAFIVISKSGTTIEILWNYSVLQNYFKSQLDIISNSFFISETKKNPLSDFAREHNRPLLPIPESIGGRFSVLTPVGLLVAALCNYDLQQIKLGAQKALNDENKIIYLVDQYLQSFERSETISLFWFYSSYYRWFGCWLQQLWAESLGKKETRNGLKAPDFSTPVIAIGSTDQHSILQQVAHGTKNKFVLIFDFDRSKNSNLITKEIVFNDLSFIKSFNYGDLIASQSVATYMALKQNDISCLLVNIQDENLDQYVGYIFMFFQLLVATIGYHENVNPFDQPGVSLGKTLSLKILKEKLDQSK